jgi:hypothetical protein
MKNNLKTLFFSALFFASILQISAQKTASGGLEVSPYIDLSNTKIPENARGLIIDKLGNLLTAKGITNGYDSAIIITPNINEVSKDILGSTAPVMYAVTLDVNLYIGNKIDGRLFANKNITTKGSGTSMDKAYINAFQQIQFNDPAFTSLIENAKLKIIDYYNQRCTQIINAATALGNRNQYDQAIYNLIAIPEVCTDCYAKGINLATALFNRKIDFDCKIKLNKATNLWNANQHYDGAVLAGEVLDDINPNAACFKQVQILTNNIQKRVLEVDKREWNIHYESTIGLEKDRIQAIKEIGKAYGEGQPQNINSNNNIRWW